MVGLLTGDRFPRDMAIAEALHLALAILYPPRFWAAWCQKAVLRRKPIPVSTRC